MAVLLALQEARLIRSDTRGDSTWWELSPDTLISAVLDDNRKWLRDGSNHGSWRLVPGPRTGKGPVS
jgi:hypothetical protein